MGKYHETRTTDLKKIGPMLAEGYTYAQVGEIVGLTRDQVRGIAYRYGLKSGIPEGGHCPIKPGKRDRFMRYLEARLYEGASLPKIAEEIRQRSGSTITDNAVRNWVKKLPKPARARHLENARQSRVRARRRRAVRERARRTKNTDDRRTA